MEVRITEHKPPAWSCSPTDTIGHVHGTQGMQEHGGIGQSKLQRKHPTHFLLCHAQNLSIKPYLNILEDSIILPLYSLALPSRLSKLSWLNHQDKLLCTITIDTKLVSL